MVRLLFWIALVGPVLCWRHGGEDDKTHEGAVMNQALINSILKFALRRGLTMLGGSAALVSDEQLGQVIGFVLLVGNELVNLYQAHKVEKCKDETVKIAG